MNKDFLDDINSDDFPEDEDDKVIELFKDLVRRFHEYDTDYIVNPKVYPKILKMMKIIAEAVLEEADDAQFEWEFDPLVGTKICFEITTKEEFGIYEVLEEDLALCEYVCPSKIEIQSIIADGIALMMKEMA